MLAASIAQQCGIWKIGGHALLGWSQTSIGILDATPHLMTDDGVGPVKKGDIVLDPEIDGTNEEREAGLGIAATATVKEEIEPATGGNNGSVIEVLAVTGTRTDEVRTQKYLFQNTTILTTGKAILQRPRDTATVPDHLFETALETGRHQPGAHEIEEVIEGTTVIERMAHPMADVEQSEERKM